MPHTNRKKKAGVYDKPRGPKIVHTKRQLLDDDEGWTHVVDSKKSAKPVEVKELGLKPWEGDVISGNTAVVNITYEEVEAEHARFRQQWQDSEGCTKLKALLAAKKDMVKLSNVVSLGLGSLQDWKLQARRTSHTQLAALQTIVAELGLDACKKFAQEPNFTDLDKKFLTSLGYETVEDPEAFEKIDELSLVFAVHCYPALYQQVSKKPQPAMLIANDLDEYAQNARIQKTNETEIAQDLEKLIAGFANVNFPQIRYDFSDTKIYTKAAAEKS